VPSISPGVSTLAHAKRAGTFCTTTSANGPRLNGQEVPHRCRRASRVPRVPSRPPHKSPTAVVAAAALGVGGKEDDESDEWATPREHEKCSTRQGRQTRSDPGNQRQAHNGLWTKAHARILASARCCARPHHRPAPCRGRAPLLRVVRSARQAAGCTSRIRRGSGDIPERWRSPLRHTSGVGRDT
jgi:hypothetical protein